MVTTHRETLLLSAGLWVAPLAWSVSTQLGEMLPHADCPAFGGGRLSLASALVALALSAAAAIVSAGALARVECPDHTARFLGGVSALSACLFAFAIVMQATASWMIDPCQRF